MVDTHFEKLKIKFKGYETLKESYSQAGQDLFVLCVLDGKKNGKFLDIGASWPKFYNNTFLLESDYNWSGLLIEIDNEYCSQYSFDRRSEFICGDATSLDYVNIFSNLKEVDYLSLDIDGLPTLDVLKRLDLGTNQISVVTFEHDIYKSDSYIRDESRKIFESFGYVRLCSDVCNGGNSFEDWYITQKIYDEKFKVLESVNNEWTEIIYNK
jgi:hypothetical protein